MKKLYESTIKATIEKKVQIQANKVNKNTKYMVLSPKNLVWVQLRKEHFLEERNTLMFCGDGHFQVVHVINCNNQKTTFQQASTW
jgi:hypothetical protein